jgi:DNA polymerase III alpha subunit (gram-positive type)
LGWVINDRSGKELKCYEKLWKLPSNSRVAIHRKASDKHLIFKDTLRREGVHAQAELKRFAAIVGAAKRAGVRLVAHNKSFDVRLLNQTASAHGVEPFMATADVFCTYQHPKSKKKNADLYKQLFNQDPPGQLHRALADARITAAIHAEGSKLKWW